MRSSPGSCGLSQLHDHRWAAPVLHGPPPANAQLNRPSTDYATALREAHTEDEIETYLNADLLRRLWHTLTLPRAVRDFWQAQHPILAS